MSQHMNKKVILVVRDISDSPPAVCVCPVSDLVSVVVDSDSSFGTTFESSFRHFLIDYQPITCNETTAAIAMAIYTLIIAGVIPYLDLVLSLHMLFALSSGLVSVVQ